MDTRVRDYVTVLKVCALCSLVLMLAVPVFANPSGSNLSLSTNPSSVPTNGVTTIQLCMTGGSVGTIAARSSTHGTSGLLVKSPGTGKAGTETSWTFDAAKGVVLPACPGQPLPSVCPSPPIVPGADQSRECTNGTYDVKFGGISPGWTKLSGKVVGQTSEGGTYTVNVDYKQGAAIIGKGAFFDVTGHFQVPEFAGPALAVSAVSLIGLVLIRRKFVPTPT